MRSRAASSDGHNAGRQFTSKMTCRVAAFAHRAAWSAASQLSAASETEMPSRFVPVPEEASAIVTAHGLDIRVLVPGSGGLIVAGTRSTEGTQHGVFRLEDQRVADALCEALDPE